MFLHFTYSRFVYSAGKVASLISKVHSFVRSLSGYYPILSHGRALL